MEPTIAIDLGASRLRIAVETGAQVRVPPFLCSSLRLPRYLVRLDCGPGSELQYEIVSLKRVLDFDNSFPPSE